jgi:hypothetical protein
VVSLKLVLVKHLLTDMLALLRKHLVNFISIEKSTRAEVNWLPVNIHGFS